MSSVRYMLDTNTVSYFLRSDPAVTKRLLAVPMSALCLSAITEGELLFGIAKRPEATHLARAVREFLRRVTALPWDNTVTERYGLLRASMALQGHTLGSLDMLIGAHAAAVGAILVTSDQAFQMMDGLVTEDWRIKIKHN
ncbi:MAG: type II toxin-antitoxin system VapC family toxin [Cytophagales bacterium]|nr:type II toxin-antitoxin system VapC family toxin [Cytophagales bacterium]